MRLRVLLFAALRERAGRAELVVDGLEAPLDLAALKRELEARHPELGSLGHVAGVVGEMLTELFCLYSPEVARHRDKLEKLAVSFGQGLQMTNILKDLWTDKNRDVCWLPRDVFAAHGFDLSRLAPETRGEEGYQAGLVTLIGITLGHLKNALSYTLAIPKSEPGIRRFCLWAIGMAVLTLRKIDRNRGYISGNEVKISRKSVMATIVATNAAIFSDSLLSRLFEATASGLPHLPIKPRHPR